MKISGIFVCFVALLITSSGCGVKGSPMPPLDDPIHTLGGRLQPSPTPSPSPATSPWINQ